MKFRIGQPYYIEFYDHFIGNDEDEEILCKCLGFVTAEDKRYVRFIYWKSKSALKDEKTEKDNVEAFKILKATIKKKRLIRIN